MIRETAGRVAAAAMVACLGSTAAAQSAPTTGAQVLQRMHDAYAGRWYHTLTFRQKTTAYRNGQPTVSNWYESLRHTPQTGTQLRIDMDDLAEGNGVLYTADSSWVVRGGKLTAARAARPTARLRSSGSTRSATSSFE